MTAAGTKTIELRLYDQRRREIAPGDTITFTNTADETQQLTVQVVKLHVFDSFRQLYSSLPLLQCGYTPENVHTADPADMDAYYPPERQRQHRVVGIELRRI